MALPASVTLVPVHVRVLHANEAGTPAIGAIAFAMPFTLRDTTGAVILGRWRFVATLDDQGEATILLPATDDPDLSPSGWAYRVTPSTDAWHDAPFDLQVPAATVGTLELAQHAPASASPAVATYTLLSQHQALVDRVAALEPAPTTDLADWLTGYTAGISPAQPYREPTAQEAADGVLGIERLALGADAAELLAPLGYTVTTGTDSASRRPYALAVDEAGTDRSWGAVLVDRSRPIGLTIQCPHPVSDQHSELVALELWRAVPGALLVIAGAHRDATGVLQSGYPLADPGKQIASLFHQVVAAYTARGVPGVQLHGYADASAPGLTHIVSTGSGNTGPAARRIAEELNDVGFGTGVACGWDSSGNGTGLTGLTNVQGDHAHSLGVPWCHLEMSATVRGSAEHRARTVAALAGAQPELPAPVLLAQPTSGQFPAPVGTTNTAGTSPFAARADHIHRERPATLARIDVLEQRTTPPTGLLGVSFDALTATSNTGTGVAFTAGVLHLVRVHVPVAGTVSSVYLGVVTAGSGLTAGACWAGLYSAAGALLGQTADQATTWSTSGLKPMPLTGPVDVAAGYHYVGVLVAGTTLPQFARSAIAVAGTLTAGASTGAHRQMTGPTGQTTLPASLAMASGTATSWVLWTALN